MAFYKLHCPACAGYFDFQLDSAPVSEHLVCPICGSSLSFSDYSALMKCPHCSVNLEVPVEMFSENSLYCPQCNREFDVWAAHDLAADFDASADALYKVGNGEKTLLQENDIFDKYRVIKLLGKGGMSEVYLAEHLFLKQKCALKVMKQNAVGNDLVNIKRFVREAKISHAIDHPNITKVYDVGNNSKTGLFFIAMEFVEGKTLLEFCAGRTMSDEELIFVGTEMSKALAELEKHHVVHRDIKPSNIMITPDGMLKLMDLGIAKSNSGDSGDMTLTMEQTTIGTPGYASPEQCKSARTVDARADIYCLGSTLYHLASGKVPFDGETLMEILLKVMQEMPDPLAKLRPDLSRHTVSLIEKMMEKDPAKRPQNAEQLLELFQKRHAGISAYFLRFSRWLRGRKYRVALVCAIPLLLLTAVLLIAGLARQGRKAPAGTPGVQKAEILQPSSGTSGEKGTPLRETAVVSEKAESAEPVSAEPPEKSAVQALAAQNAARTSREFSDNTPQPVWADLKTPGKPVLPANGIRTLKYRVDFAEWKWNQLLQLKEEWFLKKEQIDFFRRHLAELKKGQEERARAKTSHVPELMPRDYQLLKSCVGNTESNVFSMKYSFDNRLPAPDGKDYTLFALCCAGLLYPAMPPYMIRVMYFDPDCQLLVEQMRKNIQPDSNGPRVHRLSDDILIGEFLHRMVLLGRDDIDHFDENWSFLEYMVQSCPESDSWSVEIWKTIRTMLKMGCDPNVFFADGRTLLHYAAQQRDCEDVILMLYFLGFDQWNRKDKQGETAFASAVRFGNLSALELLEQIPGVSRKLASGDQAQYELYQAVAHGEIAQIQTALNAGADVNVAEDSRAYLLLIAAERNQLKSYQALELYIPVENCQTVTMLLKGAVKGNSPAVMEYLLKKYAKFGIANLLEYQNQGTSIPYVILNRYGQAPDKAIPLLELCCRYGWNFRDEQGGSAYLAFQDMIPRVHSDIGAFFEKLRQQPEKKKSDADLPSRLDLLYPMQLDADGYVVLKPSGGDRICMGSAFILKKTVTPPYTLRTVCKVSGPELRFCLSNGTVIFNWERDPKDLRLNLPKLRSPRYKVADGRLPAGEWVEIKFTVTSDRLMIFVNGKRINSSRGDFEASPVGMYTCYSGSAVIKAFSVKPE